AYLFTREAVESRAIVARFQREVMAAEQTVLFETGPGHAVRCARTPYFDAFNAEKRRLQASRRSHREIVQTLEMMNLGRLRVASKGLQRVNEPQGESRGLAEIGEEEQYRRGMYMVGQVAALRNKVTSMSALHEEVCNGGSQRLRLPQISTMASPSRQPCDTAIVGMSAFYPGATGLEQYWENILGRRNSVTEIPGTHWDWRLYYDSNPATPDRTVSKWGGFLDDVTFDPLKYGIAPNSLPAIEPLQLLVLEGVRRALCDAGYERRPFDREHTCTILGTGGSGSAKAVAYGLRACLPMFDAVDDLGVSSQEMLEKLRNKLPEWTEDSFPGILLNVAAGRVANRFDLGGANYAVDAACASSLAAVHAGIRELELGTSNVAIAIGADTVQTPYAYVAFSKTHALSPRGRCRPFDANADGIVLSEGVGVVVLKRLADAERDGDRIYAVIKGVGASSDGMDKGLTAPNVAGQARAIRRAFDVAGFSPARITLLEAHGTGT
ncbi:MAG: beta-ketoacyl synthase N-terminal-like domain-containing protein, partial [Planctomycetota bacterium]